VKLDKYDAFNGREALLKVRDAPLLKRLLAFTFDDPQAFPWGGEPILIDGRPVGELSSAGYSRQAGRAIALGYVRMEQAMTNDALAAARCEVDIAGERTRVAAHSPR